MENNFEKLLDATRDHLNNKKYLVKPIIKKKYNNGNEVTKPTTDTPNKNVMLSIALNMALKNYTDIRKKTSTKKPLDLSEISDMLLRYFNNKFIDKIGDITLIDEKQNYQYEVVKKFMEIEHKLFATVNRLRNYHSHYVHEPGILTFDDLFENDDNLKKDDFEEAKFWFQHKFEVAKEHLVNSLKERKKLIEQKIITNDPDKKKFEEDKKGITNTLKDFDKINFLRDDGSLTVEGQLFIAAMFLFKRQIKIVLEKWRGFRLDKDIAGYGNSIHTFFTYYCLSESYSLNNFNDDLLKFRDITSKLTTIPNIPNTQLEPIYEAIRQINEINYANIETIKKYDLKKIKLSIDDKVVIDNYKKQEKLKIQLIALRESLAKETDNKIKKLYQNEIDKVIFEIEKLDYQNKIIPIRNRNVITNVCLQYLLDNNLINNNFEIAIAKTAVDRFEYFKKHEKDGINEKESLEMLKDRIKMITDTEKKSVLREHYKELKRNFMFKTPDELKEMTQFDFAEVDEDEENEKQSTEISTVKGYKFSNQEKNALFKYHFNNNGNDYTMNVIISPQLLIKWVFVHLVKNNNDGLKQIEDFLNIYLNRCINVPNIDSKKMVDAYVKKYEINADDYSNDAKRALIHQKTINLNKIFPRSIMQLSGYRKREIDIEQTLKDRIERLENFLQNNRVQPKPWTYRSKQKMDTIIEYLHFKLLEDVYVNNINKLLEAETFIRHTYFGIDDYDMVRQYLRYFGRYEKNTIEGAKDYGKEGFVQPVIIDNIKSKYEIVFGYIKDHIGKNLSLEELFNGVTADYIDQLKNMLPEINGNEEKLIKILKIDTGTKEEYFVNNLKNHYLKTIALSDEIISVSATCHNELKEIISKFQNNGKPQNYTDYTFIRAYFERKEKVSTNADFILKHIVPKVHFKDLKGAKKIPNTVLKKLLKIKTEELIMWNIAKTYWQKANKKAAYQMEDYFLNNNSSSYQVFNTFNKVYKKDLDYVIEIKPDFWKKDENRSKFKLVLESNPKLINQITEIKLKVPAKRYDNRFLLVETQLITEYCLWNHCKNNEIFLPEKHTYINGNKVLKELNLTKYDGLIKMIHIELKRSLSYIGYLLAAEKRIVDRKEFDTEKYLSDKYKSEASIKDFYLTITDKEMHKDYNKALFNGFLSQIKPTDNIREYLVKFRNYALHYQLQDPKRSKEIDDMIKKIMKDVNSKDYYTKENDQI